MMTEEIDAVVIDGGNGSKSSQRGGRLQQHRCGLRPVARRHRDEYAGRAHRFGGRFTWALILGVTRRLGEGERLVRRGEWKGWAFDFMLGTELRGKQLGLIGVGRIGRAVAAGRRPSACVSPTPVGGRRIVQGAKAMSSTDC